MKLLVGTLFALLAFPVQAEQSNGTARRLIVGGIQAPRNQFSYQVGLMLTILEVENPRLCGGSLISSTRVLTAAHCLKDVTTAHVVLGAHTVFEKEPLQVRIDVPASEFIVHPGYIFKKKINDIGMIKLPSAVRFNNAISPIELADGSSSFVGDKGVISGWGYFDEQSKPSPFLRFSSLNIISNEACSAVFGDFIIDSSICAQGGGNAGACFGDSGGPLAIESNGRTLLVGIASFTAKSGCERGATNGFARVSSFISWINSNLS